MQILSNSTLKLSNLLSSSLKIELTSIPLEELRRQQHSSRDFINIYITPHQPSHLGCALASLFFVIKLNLKSFKSFSICSEWHLCSGLSATGKGPFLRDNKLRQLTRWVWSSLEYLVTWSRWMWSTGQVTCYATDFQNKQKRGWSSLRQGPGLLQHTFKCWTWSYIEASEWHLKDISAKYFELLKYLLNLICSREYLFTLKIEPSHKRSLEELFFAMFDWAANDTHLLLPRKQQDFSATAGATGYELIQNI